MSSSWEGWSQSLGTGWWTWHGSNQEWVKAEEERTDWHAAREQQDARTANCGGGAAVAAASDTAVAADAGQEDTMAASYTAVVPDVGQEDTMAAPSSALPAPQEVIPYEVFRTCSQVFGNYRQHNAALKFWREELEHRSYPLGHRTRLFPQRHASPNWDGRMGQRAGLVLRQGHSNLVVLARDGRSVG